LTCPSAEGYSSAGQACPWWNGSVVGCSVSVGVSAVVGVSDGPVGVSLGVGVRVGVGGVTPGGYVRVAVGGVTPGGYVSVGVGEPRGPGVAVAVGVSDGVELGLPAATLVASTAARNAE
jgi:hypothetical protein